MAIEGLDAGLPIEVAGFVPQVGILSEAEAGLTLDAALAAAARAAEVPQAGAEDATARERAAPDLWVSARPGYRPELQLAQLDPVAGMFVGEADTATTDPLIHNKLTVDDATRASLGGYGDSDQFPIDPEDDFPPIIIRAPSRSYWDDHPFDPGDNDHNPDGWGNGGGGGGGDPPPPPPAIQDEYADRVHIDPSVPPSMQAEAAAIAAKLAQALREAGATFNALNDNQIYNFKGHDLTGAQIKEAFSRLEFNITFGKNYGPGGNGANVDGVVSNNLDWLDGQLAQGEPYVHWGSNWLIIHEMAHLLGFMRDFERGNWLAYLASDSTPTLDEWQATQWFRDIEDMNNDLTYFLGQELNMPTGPYAPIPIPPPGPGGPGGGGTVLE